VPVVNRVADTLADEVIADGPAAQIIFFQQVAFATHIAIIFQRLIHLKVIAPAGQLQAVKAPLADFLGQRFEWEIGPLAGEEGYRSWHDFLLMIDIGFVFGSTGFEYKNQTLPQ
jgi:hypothetical protein